MCIRISYMFSAYVGHRQVVQCWKRKLVNCYCSFNVLFETLVQFTPQMALVVDTTYLHKFFLHFFATLVLMHFVLFDRFVAQMSSSFSILVPRMCVLYHNFYCIFSCYLPPNKPGLKWLNSCVNLTRVVQWLRLALSKGPNWVGAFSLPHLRTETDPIFEMSCFLFSRLLGDGKSPETQ
jgi:hypothetical protein